jgi:hypothetical protein
MEKKYWLFIILMCFFIWSLISPLMLYAKVPSPRKNISIEPRWGYFFWDSAKAETEISGKKYEIIGGFKFNLELFRQFLQIGIGSGYMRANEKNYFIYNIPIEASLNLRFKFSPQQFIIPYIGGGADYSYFKQKNVRFEQDPNGAEKPGTVHINRKGYHMNAGFQFLLNRLSPKASKQFDEKFGVNATYLTFEARYTDLTNFDDLKSYETDMSGWFYYMGLLFEF